MTPPRRGIVYYNDILEDWNGRVALWRFGKGTGYGIYLYENENWQIEDDWLLYTQRREQEKALEIFRSVSRLQPD